jgi:DNA recombination protein RmuC
MLEILLVVTLIAACATAGMMAIMLGRERATAREAREELSRGLMGFSQTVATQMSSIASVQTNQVEHLRKSLEDGLARMQQDNAAKLEQMRQTVDEKLHATLELRLAQSFKQVSERLEQVHKGLGEMQSLATGVGDLKRVLTNVKVRGTWGEVQLGSLLEQMLTADQYAKNVATRPASRERVEYAIRLPGRDGQDQVWLPVDAKFPVEDYERLIAAQERADPVAVEEAAKALEGRVKLEARTIREKYLEPPATTDFAILFVPTEGLYAELARRPGLADVLQREHRVTIAGPMNLAMIINSLQMGFRTLAIEKRASEVWQVLGGVRTEFGRFIDVLARTKAQLQTVANSIEAAETRTRQIERKLKDVEALPGEQAELLDEGKVVRLPENEPRIEPKGL